MEKSTQGYIAEHGQADGRERGQKVLTTSNGRKSVRCSARLDAPAEDLEHHRDHARGHDTDPTVHEHLGQNCGRIILISFLYDKQACTKRTARRIQARETRRCDVLRDPRGIRGARPQATRNHKTASHPCRSSHPKPQAMS